MCHRYSTDIRADIPADIPTDIPTDIPDIPDLPSLIVPTQKGRTCRTVRAPQTGHTVTTAFAKLDAQGRTR
jgi:hypothetical protein